MNPDTTEGTDGTVTARETAGATTDVLDLLSQESVRRILVESSDGFRSAAELAERCDLSPATVYRHVDALQEAGLLDERVRIDRSGDHFREFETSLDSVNLSFASDGTDLEIEFR